MTPAFYVQSFLPLYADRTWNPYYVGHEDADQLTYDVLQSHFDEAVLAGEITTSMIEEDRDSAMHEYLQYLKARGYLLLNSAPTHGSMGIDMEKHVDAGIAL